MHAIGLSLVLAGFSGVPALLILVVTRNLALSLTSHVLVLLVVLSLLVKRAGSFKAWRTQKFSCSYNVHPSVVLLIGLVFASLGPCVMDFGIPAEMPNIVNRADIFCFGGIFLFLGSGVAVISGTDWARGIGKSSLDGLE